jgi:hypothetical protein
MYIPWYQGRKPWEIELIEPDNIVEGHTVGDFLNK